MRIFIFNFMFIFRFVFMIVFMIVATFSSANATVEGAAPPKALMFPDWGRIPLSGGGVFAELYKNSIAKDIFVHLNSKDRLPFVQHLEREASDALAPEALKLLPEILANLDVNASAPSTIHMKTLKFKVDSLGREGVVEELNSGTGDDTYITCVAFVRQGSKIHAFWVEAARASLPTCAQQLMDLGRSAPY